MIISIFSIKKRSGSIKKFFSCFLNFFPYDFLMNFYLIDYLFQSFEGFYMIVKNLWAV